MAESKLACTAKVHFPLPGKPIKHNAFFATGRTPAVCGPVRGVLYKDGSSETYNGDTKREPEKFVIYFKILNPNRNATYTLKIYQKTSGTLLATVEKIQIIPTFGVGISFPDSPATCCSDYFTAQGTLSNPDTAIASAKMTLDGGNPVDSNTPIINGTDWFADWPVLPPSTSPAYYTLNVTGNNGGADAKNTLTLTQASPPC
jgi:hypothetical protein